MDRAVQWKLRRGMRELDLLLGGFYERRWETLPGGRRQAFRNFLECGDDQLWDWLTGRAEPENDAFAFIVDDIRRHAGH